LYTAREDIEQISNLMHDLQEGRISRNKNYYTLAKSKEFNRFKRAKLLISLIEDLDKTAKVVGNLIKVDKVNDCIEVSLYNPNLKYNRRVVLTEAELNLIRSQIKEADLS